MKVLEGLGGVFLFEQVWPCWRKCVTGISFEVSKVHNRPSATLFLCSCRSSVALSSTLACHHDNEPLSSATVSKPQLNAFSHDYISLLLNLNVSQKPISWFLSCESGGLLYGSRIFTCPFSMSDEALLGQFLLLGRLAFALETLHVLATLYAPF